jgi:hypothetical protein
MQPDNSTGTRQGSADQHGARKQKKATDDRLTTHGPGEPRQADAGDDEIPGRTAPAERHPNRTAQNSEGGDFNGPDKGSLRR